MPKGPMRRVSQHSNWELLPPEMKVLVPTTETMADLAERLDAMTDYCKIVVDALGATPLFWNMKSMSDYGALVSEATEYSLRMKAKGVKPLDEFELDADGIDKLKGNYAFVLTRSLSKLKMGMAYVDQMKREGAYGPEGLTDPKGKAHWWVAQELYSLMSRTLGVIKKWSSLLEYERRHGLEHAQGEDPIAVHRQAMAKVLSGESGYAD